MGYILSPLKGLFDVFYEKMLFLDHLLLAADLKASPPRKFSRI